MGVWAEAFLLSQSVQMFRSVKSATPHTDVFSTSNAFTHLYAVVQLPRRVTLKTYSEDFIHLTI